MDRARVGRIIMITVTAIASIIFVKASISREYIDASTAQTIFTGLLVVYMIIQKGIIARQADISHRQASIMDKHTDISRGQTEVMERQNDISDRQTNIMKSQVEIAAAQSDITDFVADLEYSKLLMKKLPLLETKKNKLLRGREFGDLELCEQDDIIDKEGIIALTQARISELDYQGQIHLGRSRERNYSRLNEEQRVIFLRTLDLIMDNAFKQYNQMAKEANAKSKQYDDELEEISKLMDIDDDNPA